MAAGTAALALPGRTAMGAEPPAPSDESLLQGARRLTWSRQPRTPRLQLTALDGSGWRLEAQRGQAVLLNFWASWCDPCRAEMPSLQTLAERHAGKLQVLAVNYRENTPAVQRFVQATGLRLPVLRDGDGAAAQLLAVHVFPTTLGIDRQGRVRFEVQGGCDWAGVQAAGWVRELLAA